MDSLGSYLSGITRNWSREKIIHPFVNFHLPKHPFKGKYKFELSDLM